ncbi:unnamed protein product [Anisakis simplex]|uniref:BZIP domain-containing protein n=1 Tax=Anisakis simplex TaxID=6269 RepID=A0A0M3JZF3_ANISI|nr:unnamed protein product [Anisakis simplex]
MRRVKEAQNRARMLSLDNANNHLRAQIDALRGQLNHMHLLLVASKVNHSIL